ncbi:motile sperm domain-containing protein 2-like [Oppia nitens]|uniref:motile sperm domain-containing protein 2-like n=1 Tax=Oppia nitens TaxID=1686743 RepID=UPI0023D984E8|nr:motile sperm domain-containing protein 2-like [Oppia nitens]
MRQKFLSIVNKSSYEFDKRDIEMVRLKDWWIERFLLVSNTEDEALDSLVDTMKWRKQFGVNDLTESSFPEELYRIGEFLQFCRDREGRQVLWLQMHRHHKCDEDKWYDMAKHYIVYWLELYDRNNTHKGGWAMVSDCSQQSLSNVDMDLNSFVVNTLQSRYPKGPKYLLSIDLPWLLNFVAKIVVSFMNDELRAIYKPISSSELDGYIAPEYIPVHLTGGKYDKPLIQVPAGVKPLTKFPNFTDSDISNIYETNGRLTGESV